MRIHMVGLPLLAVTLLTTGLRAQVVQEAVDLGVVARIRDEGLARSQLPAMARHLTEVIGPRLTGSTGMRKANEWTVGKFEEWGLANARMESWGEFGRGWERVSYSGRMLTPFVQPLVAQPAAWSGSTDGTVAGPAVIMRVASAEDLEQYRGKLRGAFVLHSSLREVEPEFEPDDRRRSLESLLEPVPVASLSASRRAEFMRRRQLSRAIRDFLRDQGIAARLMPSSFDYGVLRGGGSSSARALDAPIPPPELHVSQEQYNFIYRNVQAGVPVELEVNVRTRFLEDDLMAYNSLADIPGSDKADEFVMIGAHLDSWHMGGGATDNGAGSVVMMEAMRILRAVGVTPRRTIRIALWSGEEQGLYGSREWLANHPELHDKISVYLNVDGGTGRIRGVYAQDNPQVIPIFEQLLFPFRDLGVVAVDPGSTGSTDHRSFDAIGIPGFNFMQDPVEYRVRTHHSALDTYDALVLDDLQQAAVVVAATAYHLAMRDEMMPRKRPPESEQGIER